MNTSLVETPRTVSTIFRKSHSTTALGARRGVPRAPIHHADDLDAKYHMMFCILRDDATTGPMTSKKNVLFQKVYKGE